MTLPAPRSCMPGRKALIVRKVAVRFPSIDACQPSSLISSRGPGSFLFTPASATRIYTGPSCRSMSSVISVTFFPRCALLGM